uniref:Uncharacterized protein n=1 Tax=Lygus hesperus TaxID=30085 RepID=A0A0A9XVB2_LYGHE
MVARSILFSVLLGSGSLFAEGGIFSGFGGFGGGSYGGFSGGGYGGITGGYSGGGYQCGTAQCVTQIQCNSCDYPQPFVQHVSYSRSVLTRVEEFIQSVGQYGVNAVGRLGNTAVSIPAGFMEMSIRNGMTLVTDITSAIENLNSYISHQVIGRVAYDIVSDLSDSLSIIRKLIGWCGSYNSGGGVIQLPQQIVQRYQQPSSWNKQCSGAWPCTSIVPYVTSQGAQSTYNNKYGYSKKHNRGSTQILNSNYDSGSDVGYGDTSAAAQNYIYAQGGYPSSGMRALEFVRSFNWDFFDEVLKRPVPVKPFPLCCRFVWVSGKLVWLVKVVYFALFD